MSLPSLLEVVLLSPLHAVVLVVDVVVSLASCFLLCGLDALATLCCRASLLVFAVRLDETKTEIRSRLRTRSRSPVLEPASDVHRTNTAEQNGVSEDTTMTPTRSTS